MTDAKAFIALAGSAAVGARRTRKIGTQGYCMGGPIAFRTAAAVPRSRRRGGLVPRRRPGDTSTPNSPHLQASKTKAQFLVAIAANDDQRAPTEKDVLKETFAKANLPAEIEVYTGAAHGWCPPDSGVYNEPQAAEKAWSRLLCAVRESAGVGRAVDAGLVPAWRKGTVPTSTRRPRAPDKYY